MNEQVPEYVKRAEAAKAYVRRRMESVGETEESLMALILQEFAVAIETKDWHLQSEFFVATCALKNSDLKAEALNTLLMMPGHTFHQEVTQEIQRLGHPLSIPYIERMLTEGFPMLEYTCSEIAAISKWFSHALAGIGTDEAIQVIRKFSMSTNEDIANEMKYRLRRIGA